PFKLLNLIGVFVDISKQAASRLAVEAGGGNELIVPLFTLRPGLRIQFCPIIPAFFWREGRELDARRAWIRSVGHVSLDESPSTRLNLQASLALVETDRPGTLAT